MSFLPRFPRLSASTSAIVAAAAVATVAMMVCSSVLRLDLGWLPRFAARVSVVPADLGLWAARWDGLARPPAQYQNAALSTLVRTTLALGVACVAIAGLSLTLHATSRILVQWRVLAVRTALGASFGHLARLVGVDLLAPTVAGWAAGGVVGTALLAAMRANWPALVERPPLLVPALAAAVCALALVGALTGVITLLMVLVNQRGVRMVSDLHGEHVTAGGPVLLLQATLAAMQLAGLLAVAYGGALVLRSADLGAGDPVAAVALPAVQPVRVDLPDARARARAWAEFPPGAALASRGAWLGLGKDVPVIAFCLCFDGQFFKTVAGATLRTVLVGPSSLPPPPTALVSGRPIAAGDTLGAPRVVVLNLEAARRLFLTPSPIGRTVRYGPGADMEYEIVGVVRTSIPTGIGSPGSRFPVAYLSLAQHPPFLADAVGLTAGSAAGQRSGLPVSQAELRREAAAPLRWFAALLAALAGSAAAVAVMALAAVMVQMVTVRRRDIAVRLALGASPRRIVIWLLARAARISLAGLIVGLTLARWIGEGLRTRFSVSLEGDLALLAVLALALAGVGVLASVLPARLAAKVEPAAVWAESQG